MTTAQRIARRPDFVPSLPWARVLAAPGALTHTYQHVVTGVWWWVAQWLTLGVNVGALITGSDGVVRGLLVSGGSGRMVWDGYQVQGGGGDVKGAALFDVTAGEHMVTVGAGGANKVLSTDLDENCFGRVSSIGTAVKTGSGRMKTGAGLGVAGVNLPGMFSDITGTMVEYARGSADAPRANRGDGTNWNAPAATGGIVIVSVPLRFAPPPSS